MPVKINVTLEDIKYAEHILLLDGETFGDKEGERVVFIQNFETIDLKAVPGSGKTTALLAKLVILERYLPFLDGSGILVLSHTNAAVDEIRNKIARHCPRLFSYPNFIGTIQSFVDEFLAIPYYINQTKKKPIRIDDEIYFEKLDAKLEYCLVGQSNDDFKKVFHIKSVNYQLLQNYRIGFNEKNERILITELNGSELQISKPRGNTKAANYKDYTEEEKNSVKEYLKNLKLSILNEGILHFDDAYFLANCYLQKFPKIKIFLQKRFRFIFVDEMQDMDKHQYKLLEKLFYADGQSSSKYQRIGDKNQAIFNGDAKLDDIWEDENRTTLEINGSYRLNKYIADVVQPFALYPIVIDGLKKNKDGSEIDIKPYLIIYDDDTKTQVIKKFAIMIKDFQNEGKISKDLNNKYHAIAWRKEHSDEKKICLASYFKSFSKEEHQLKADYNALECYLTFYDKDKTDLEVIRKNILGGLLKIMRLEGIKDDDGRDFTKYKLISHLSQLNDAASARTYENFKLKVYQWSIGVIKNKKDILKDMQTYIPEFLRIFNKTIIKSRNFIDSPINTIQTQLTDNDSKHNVFKHEDIEVKIGTVHSVKGQTHTATLYLESFYDRGYGNYESERLRNQFKKQSVPLTLKDLANSHDKVKQSAKVVYVGFSRPTHLLCFALHKDRFSLIKDDPNLNSAWKIISLE